jgi:hypothetical protein
LQLHHWGTPINVLAKLKDGWLWVTILQEVLWNVSSWIQWPMLESWYHQSCPCHPPIGIPSESEVI